MPNYEDQHSYYQTREQQQDHAKRYLGSKDIIMTEDTMAYDSWMRQSRQSRRFYYIPGKRARYRPGDVLTVHPDSAYGKTKKINGCKVLLQGRYITVNVYGYVNPGYCIKVLEGPRKGKVLHSNAVYFQRKEVR